MVERGNVCAAQFHPEKSGAVGLEMIRSFLVRQGKIARPQGNLDVQGRPITLDTIEQQPRTTLVKRIIACLDVRSNDHGDLVVTKGDQYDVRESTQDTAGR